MAEKEDLFEENYEFIICLEILFDNLYRKLLLCIVSTRCDEYHGESINSITGTGFFIEDF